MKEIVKYVIGDIDLYFLAAFYFYVLFGAIFSMLLHYKYKNFKRVKSDKKKEKFNFLFWLKDNTIRLLTIVMVVFVVVVFKDNIPVLKNFELNTWLGLLLGCSMDGAIIFLRNKTEINIFQNSVATKQGK